MTHKSPRHVYDDYKILGLEMRKLKDRIAELEAALFLSRVAWENALEVGLFPPEYGKTALELIEHHRAALKAKP
jgi:hypothetical protein